MAQRRSCPKPPYRKHGRVLPPFWLTRGFPLDFLYQNHPPTARTNPHPGACSPSSSVRLAPKVAKMDSALSAFVGQTLPIARMVQIKIAGQNYFLFATGMVQTRNKWSRVRNPGTPWAPRGSREATKPAKESGGAMCSS